MEIQKFVKNISALYDETDISEFATNTRFKENDEWSSLLALTIIAMVDEEYNVKIKGVDINKSTTINDLFNLVINCINTNNGVKNK